MSTLSLHWNGMKDYRETSSDDERAWELTPKKRIGHYVLVGLAVFMVVCLVAWKALE